jgi:hypothetical protein
MAIVVLTGVAAGMLYVVQPDMFAPVVSRFQTIQEDRGSERLEIWQGAMKAFRENPIIGVGCDNFKVAVNRYYGEEFLAHSIYIGTLVELGILGFGLMLWWFGTLARKTWQAQDRLWVFPLLVVYLFEGAFLHEFYFSCFWLALGLAEGALPAQVRGVSVPPQPTQQRLAGLPASTRPGGGMRRIVPVRLMWAGTRLARDTVHARVRGGRP